jgi:hypothetical protein
MWPILILGTATALAIAIASSSARADDVKTTPSPSGSAKRAAVEAAARNAGLPDPWVQWVIWVAKGESNYSLTAHNDSPGERSASRKAYNRLVSEGRWPAACPKDESRYAIGSGGWGGQLAPYTVVFLARLGAPSALYCDPKAAWKDPRAAIAAHLEQVRGTLNILRSKTGNNATFLQLRALYGLPSRNPFEVDTPKRRAAYTKTLQAAGISPAFLDTPVPNLPPVVF